MRVLLLLILLTGLQQSFAQTVVIKKVELAGEQVIVHYDLDDSNPNNEYLINLYTSKDNFNAALTKVSGDVGMDVKPGVGKKIVWMITQEYGGYKGKLALEIRGKVYVPFVRLQGFDVSKTYKKGKTYQLKWKPGNSNPVNIELYNGGERISGETNQPNNGSHSLFIPKHAGKSKEYRVRFTDTRSPEDVVYTDYFKVGSSVPLVAKIAGGAVVVGAIIFVATRGGGDGGPGDTPPPADEIATPKLPGGE